MNQAVGEAEQGQDGPDEPSRISVLDAVTPGRKRKVRYESQYSTPSKLKLREDLQESFEDELVVLSSQDSMDQSEDEKLKMVLNQWDLLVNMVNKLGSGLRTLKGTVGEDLFDLDHKLLTVDANLGRRPRDCGLEDCASAWDGLAFLASQVKEVGKAQAQAKDSFTSSMESMDNKLSTSVARAADHMRTRVDQEIGMLGQGLREVAEFAKLLAAEQEKVVETVLAAQAANQTSTAGNAELQTLKAQMLLIEARLPNHNAGRLGGNLFQSRADVCLFVEKHVPSNAFHLFHDVVTLLESLTTSHVERKDVLQEWYQSAKVGVNEAAARHMASFRLVLPTVFGRVKDGSPTTGKHHLPAIKSFKEWNTYDGVSGVKSYINTGMEDLKYQLRQDIDHSFNLEQHYNARLLAMEMHELSQNFVLEMSSWMDAFYQELVTTSEASEDEAWDVVGACIRKVFEILRVPRAQASNATMDGDLKSQCATYLWALIQSHKVMKEFIDARFRNHGAIAPVIVIHIFKTRVTRVTMAASVKRLEGRLAALEKVKDGKTKEPKVDKDGKAK